jgi:hypothetical protein
MQIMGHPGFAYLVIKQSRPTPNSHHKRAFIAKIRSIPGILPDQSCTLVVSSGWKSPYLPLARLLHF